MGAKGQDGVAGLPGEKVSLCILICSLTHGKCSWEDRTLLLENELLLPALPCSCSTPKKPLGPIVFSAGALFCLGFFFFYKGGLYRTKGSHLFQCAVERNSGFSAYTWKPVNI